MQPEAITLGGVIEEFRRAFGTQEWVRLTLPSFLLDLGSRLGDLASWLGWMPPMRSTAIAELRRGVTGDPGAWMAATGITPQSIGQMVGARTATIQDKWFARLFLVKALVIASLVLFWLVSGFIAVALAFVAKGPVTALIMLGVVIAVQQLESHVLQPFLLGRAVSVHPLAVILSITAGVVIAGIVGALVAVPLAAVVNAVVKHLTGGDRSTEDTDESAEPAAGVSGPTPPGEAEVDAEISPS